MHFQKYLVVGGFDMNGLSASMMAWLMHLHPFLLTGHCLGDAPGPPAPVPILPRERSNFDKVPPAPSASLHRCRRGKFVSNLLLPSQVVEYLVGDGPSNRYALICSECHSHNGMALKDQFPYLSMHITLSTPSPYTMFVSGDQ